jgi:hypothetical protein
MSGVTGHVTGLQDGMQNVTPEKVFWQAACTAACTATIEVSLPQAEFNC